MSTKEKPGRPAWAVKRATFNVSAPYQEKLLKVIEKLGENNPRGTHGLQTRALEMGIDLACKELGIKV